MSTAPMTRPVRPVVAIALLSIALLPGFIPALPALAADGALPATAVRNPASKFPIFIDLFGTWRGEGVVGTLPSKIEMTWSPVIDSRFIRVHWVNEMTTKVGGILRFEGEGTYRPNPDADGNHTGTWYDSQSTVHPLFGRAAGDSLATIWGTEGGTQGRTTYRLIDRGTIRVHDEIRREGQWRTFGVSTLVKQPTD